MKTSNITNLIQIRGYVLNAINNYTLPKETSKTLSKMLTVLDNRIVENIISNDFKELIGFEDAAKMTMEAMKNNNIKRDLKVDENGRVINTDKVVVATPGTKDRATIIKAE